MRGQELKDGFPVPAYHLRWADGFGRSRATLSPENSYGRCDLARFDIPDKAHFSLFMGLAQFEKTILSKVAAKGSVPFPKQCVPRRYQTLLTCLEDIDLFLL